jgi:phage shock protein E
MPNAEDILTLANDARTRIREISPDEAGILVASGALLLDVREEKEFKAGHIPGANHLSREYLETRIPEIAPEKSASIVCYCAIGHRSAIAADTLQKLGYSNVASIAGGLKAYLASSSARRSA